MRHKSLRETAYDIIKEKLLTQEIVPGGRIREDFLAEDIAMSRTPVREAVQQLTAEGFIRSVPRKGLFAVEMKGPHIHNMLDVRIALEKLAVTECIDRIDAKGIEQLDKCIAESRKALLLGDFQQFNLLDSKLHKTIGSITGNQMLMRFLAEIEDFMQIARVTEKKHLTRERCEEAFAEHTALVDAIKARDGRAAKTAVVTNIETLRKRLERDGNLAGREELYASKSG